MESRTAVLGFGGLVWLISVGCGAESSNGEGTAGSAGAVGVAGRTARPYGQGGDWGDDMATGACEQGDMRACLGPARCDGAQFCDGVRCRECDCGDAPNGGTAAGGTRAGNGGTSQGGKGGGTFADAGEGPIFNGGVPASGGTSQGGTSTSQGGTTTAEAGVGGEGGFVSGCGAPGQQCCSGAGRGSGTRCQKNYQCCSTGSVGKCVQCGGTWQACCSGPGAVACRHAADECFLGQCEGSGGYSGAF